MVANGRALQKFREIVSAQGGDVRVIEDSGRLPRAKHTLAVVALRSGVIADVDAMKVALAAVGLGAGRARAEDAVDPAVGISELVKIGERVEAGATLCRIHASEAASAGVARETLQSAIVIGDQTVTAPELIGEVLGAE